MAHWKNAFCNANGITLHYSRTGGDKPVLILLHGLAASGACWTEVAHLLGNDFDLIMPDARGHGRSTVPVSGYGYPDHANDVIGLIHSLKLSSTILLGHSMGGMTSALAARLYPGLFRGIILADPTFLTPEMQQEVYTSDLASQHQSLSGKTFEGLVSDLRKRHPHRSSQTIETIARARLQTALAAFDVLTPPLPDYKTLVSALKVPGLLIFGDKGVITSRVAGETQRINPLFRSEQIPEAGHGLHYDQPARFAAVIRSFILSMAVL